MWSAEGSRRRRDREASHSDPRDRDRKRRREKDAKEEKREKPEKRDKRDGHHDRGGGDHKKRGDHAHDGHSHGDDHRQKERGSDARHADKASERGRGGNGRGEDEKQARLLAEETSEPPIPPIEGFGKAKNWREEMGGEDERDLSDDEDATERKLAESRKRREAMMAKWVTKDTPETEKAEDEQADAARTPSVGTAGGGAQTEEGECSGSDTAAVEKPKAEKVSREQKQEVTKFILEQRAEKEKASQGDMFDENADAAALNASMKQSAAIGQTGASGDDWDDPDGYYIAKIGEVMAERYLVVENVCGKGVFSTVIKAKDQVNKDVGMVAIKVMRANDMMKKAAEKEIEILERLNSADKGNKRHIIHLLSTFYYRKHLCLVFECMWDDLRQALKKYTKNKGMAMQAVRAYTKQLVVGLRHMHKCNIIHADIKPDNILISEGHNIVKFCDLGTALELKDVAVSPYLVSRFYRAPEIILGCEYTVAVDVFALGATLYELFTGKILFNSKTNNDALRKIMEVKGKIPKHIIKKGMLWKNHFDENLDFKFEDEDKYTREKVTRVISDLSVKRDLFEMLMDRVGPDKRNSEEKEDVQVVKRAKQFADLLHQMLTIDPEKRVTANDALPHPFMEDSTKKAEQAMRAEGGGRAGSAPGKK